MKYGLYKKTVWDIYTLIMTMLILQSFGNVRILLEFPLSLIINPLFNFKIQI